MCGMTDGRALVEPLRGGDRLPLCPRREPAYGALIQVVLLGRIPALERAVGFDRLTVWPVLSTPGF